MKLEDNPDVQAALKLLETNSTKLAEAIEERADLELMLIYKEFISSYVAINRQLMSKIEMAQAIRKAKGEKE